MPWDLQGRWRSRSGEAPLLNIQADRLCCGARKTGCAHHVPSAGVLEFREEGFDHNSEVTLGFVSTVLISGLIGFLGLPFFGWPHRPWVASLLGPDPGDRSQVALEFNCSATSEEWAPAQTEWCCKHHSVGCPASPRMRQSPAALLARHDNRTQHAATTTMTTARATTTTTKTVATATTTTSTATTTTATPLEHFLYFDCSTSTGHWKVDWSLVKRQWCCRAAGVGCAGLSKLLSWQSSNGSSGHYLHFDCAENARDVEIEWSRAKQRWCCKQLGRGCGPVKSPLDDPLPAQNVAQEAR